MSQQGPGRPRGTNDHFLPVGNPAPPRPRSPESITSCCTWSGEQSVNPFRSAANPPSARYSSKVTQRPGLLCLNRTCSIYPFDFSRNAFSTTALLCSASFAAKRRVTVPALASSPSLVRSVPWFCSSASYLALNSSHFAGSCPNQRRRESLGAISLSQSSICALSLAIPLGQRRSTRIL